jgi:hypothetical protein
MKERPILFSGPMVQAILSGAKTQTRRVMKPQPGSEAVRFLNHIKGWKCPYGKPGDRLWVRETWQLVGFGTGSGGGRATVRYAADNTENRIPDDGSYRWDIDSLWEMKAPVRPSIHMPRCASRITLEVCSIRVERLQTISAEDAIAEGIREVTKDGDVVKYCVFDKGDMSSTPWAEMPRDPVTVYRQLWDKINAERGFGWDTNPYVWVVEFRRLSPCA